MDENDVVSQLNGLAFEEIGLSSEALAQLGLVSQTRAFDRSQIYNNNFESSTKKRDENGFGDDEEDYDSDDLEDEVDRELELENERMHERGLQSLDVPSNTLGGANRMGDVEDDDYDMDEEDDEHVAGHDIFGDEEEDAEGEAEVDTQGEQLEQANVTPAVALHHTSSSTQFLPPTHPDTLDSGTIHVKQEESTTILGYQTTTSITNGKPVPHSSSFIQKQEEELRAVVPAEPEELEVEEWDLAKYYPSFTTGKILDYSELFSVRPSKRQKFDKPPLKGSRKDHY